LAFAPHHVHPVVGSTLRRRMRQELAATMSRRPSSALVDSVSRSTSCSLRSFACRSRSKRSLGTCCLDSLNPHRPLTSVVTARSAFATVPAAPVGLSSLPRPRPEGPFCVGVSRACPLGHPGPPENTSSRPPGGARSSCVQTPVIVSISRCALASESPAVLRMETRWL
jgi:hypothetical protein